MKTQHLFKNSATGIVACLFLAVALLPGCNNNATDKEESNIKQPVDYVNPFIGTQASGIRKSTDGRTHPGACVPFGMTKWTPANIDNQSDPYKYIEGEGRMGLYPGILKEELFSVRGSQ